MEVRTDMTKIMRVERKATESDNALDTADKEVQGDEKLVMLYERYDGLMHAVAYKLLGHIEDTEDVVMHAWEKVLDCEHKVGDVDSPKTKSLLAMITERTAIDFLRKRYRDRDNLIYVDVYESSPFYATTDEHIALSEMGQVLRKLPKKYAEVLILHYVHEFTGEEIANLLDITVSNVMKRMERGRKYLRKELGVRSAV